MHTWHIYTVRNGQEWLYGVCYSQFEYEDALKQLRGYGITSGSATLFVNGCTMSEWRLDAALA